MRILSWIIGALGILVVVFALVGRFHGPPSILIPGTNIESSASHVILVGDTLLLIAIFLGTLRPTDKRP